MSDLAGKGWRCKAPAYKETEACTISVGVCLSRPLKRRLDKAAGESGVSRSQLIRDLLDWAMDEVAKDKALGGEVVRAEA